MHFIDVFCVFIGNNFYICHTLTLIVKLNYQQKNKFMNATKTLIVIAFVVCNTITAQVTYLDNNNLKFNSQNNCQLRYLYFPNLHAYYDKLNNVYLYQDKGIWVSNEELPPLYGGYSLFSKVRVEITDFDDDKPYTQLKNHKKQFPYSSKGHFTYQTASID